MIKTGLFFLSQCTRACAYNTSNPEAVKQRNWTSCLQASSCIVKTNTSRAVLNPLTHWGRVTHICVSDLTSIGSRNGLSPGRRQAIIRTNAGVLLIRPLGTNFSKISIEILIFSFKEMRLNVSSTKRWPFCLGLNVLTILMSFMYTSLASG